MCFHILCYTRVSVVDLDDLRNHEICYLRNLYSGDGRIYLIHSDIISSIVTTRDSVDWSVLCRLRSSDVEQGRSGCIDG
jgi:hypothetical protein